MVRRRVSEHVPGQGGQTGRGARRAPAGGWHEVIEVRMGGSKKGLKWQDVQAASWMSPQGMMQRDGMIVLDHAPANCKGDGTPLKSAGETVLSLIQQHAGRAAVRAHAEQQALRNDIPAKFRTATRDWQARCRAHTV